jgi:hypothetical protein
MKKIGILFVFLLVLFDHDILFAQTDSSKIELDLSLRERFESWDGMNAKNYGDDGPHAIGSLHDQMLLQRVIAGFVYHPAPVVDIAAHLQDSRAFGWSLRDSEYPDLFKVKAKNTQEPYYIMNPNEDFFEIYDAYLAFHFAQENLSVKLGRQKIFYGDQHIFELGDWGNTGRTWDAVKISYSQEQNFIDCFAGGTKIQDPSTTSLPFTNTEFWGGGIYAHYELSKIISIEPFYAIKTEGSADYANTLDLHRQWFGARIFNDDFYHFVYDFTWAQEWGKESNKSIDAFGAIAKLGYRFYFLPAQPLFAVRESYASGGKSSDDDIKTFDPVYGSKSQYYGRMNIVSWSNLDDREILMTLSPVKNLDIEMNYHRFYIPEPDDFILLGTMKMQQGKNHLGDEFDVYVRYQLSKQLQLISAFGYFWAGDLQPINNHPAKDASWFTLQILYAWNK